MGVQCSCLTESHPSASSKRNSKNSSSSSLKKKKKKKDKRKKKREQPLLNERTSQGISSLKTLDGLPRRDYVIGGEAVATESRGASELTNESDQRAWVVSNDHFPTSIPKEMAMDTEMEMKTNATVYDYGYNNNNDYYHHLPQYHDSSTQYGQQQEWHSHMNGDDEYYDHGRGQEVKGLIYEHGLEHETNHAIVMARTTTVPITTVNPHQDIANDIPMYVPPDTTHHYSDVPWLHGRKHDNDDDDGTVAAEIITTTIMHPTNCIDNTDIIYQDHDNNNNNNNNNNGNFNSNNNNINITINNNNNNNNGNIPVDEPNLHNRTCTSLLEEAMLCDIHSPNSDIQAPTPSVSCILHTNFFFFLTHLNDE
ncbi:hypothetical protein RFI_20666 [Reticulomyxa filosa]|uniref:Uncharacterized protein n=1 Tax=Reticulomyxa filosa TaxID=46433 RepID=X6MT90_RETFI|nr:hypothetical protein RFI_20666 [Reticulomyxa filosa]|eukprot:ETO16672.1 hypothetical protein RFI_20666 [Reticulomyxa filosa]